MRKTLIVIVLLAFCSAVFAQSTTKIMPEELIAIAANCNCEQVDNFYNRPGMIEPPYVYGFLPGEQENSAVFWCRKKNTSGKYLLVLASRKNIIDKWRYEIIIETTNYPSGLSIVKKCKIPLDKFFYISDPKKHGPKGVLPNSNVILSTYDGVSEYYYNHMGSWLISMWD